MTREELYALTPTDVALCGGTRYNVRPRNPAHMPRPEAAAWEITAAGTGGWSSFHERWLLAADWTVETPPEPLKRLTVVLCGACEGRFVQKPGEMPMSTCTICAQVEPE